MSAIQSTNPPRDKGIYCRPGECERLAQFTDLANKGQLFWVIDRPDEDEKDMIEHCKHKHINESWEAGLRQGLDLHADKEELEKQVHQGVIEKQAMANKIETQEKIISSYDKVTTPKSPANAWTKSGENKRQLMKNIDPAHYVSGFCIWVGRDNQFGGVVKCVHPVDNTGLDKSSDLCGRHVNVPNVTVMEIPFNDNPTDSKCK